MNQMTHNTQINHRDADIETILSVGRTDDGGIYIDIRIYRQGDVIEIGDITLTQDEWNTIDNNLKLEQSKLYICPECGDIVTEDDILEDLTTGGFGCCLCMYGNGSRILVRYEPYNDSLSSPITPTEMRLIKSVRELNKKYIN